MDPLLLVELCAALLVLIAIATFLFFAAGFALAHVARWRERAAVRAFLRHNASSHFEEIITIRHNGLVELGRLEPDAEFKLFPLPHARITLTENNIAAISFETLANIIRSKQPADAGALSALFPRMRCDFTSVKSQALAAKIFGALHGREWIREELTRLGDTEASRDPLAGALKLLAEATHRELLRHRQLIALRIREKIAYKLQALRDKIVEPALRALLTETLTESECDARGALPAGTVFAKCYRDTRIFVIQEKPQCHSIRVDEALFRRMGMVQRSAQTVFRLAFPYVIFIASMRSGKDGRALTGYGLHAFVAPRPLQTLNDPLFKFPLSNIHIDGRVCMSGDWQQESPGKVAAEMITHFWGSIFNGELESPSGPNYITTGPKLGDLWAWEERSAKHPLFMTEVPLIHVPSPTTVREIVNGILARHGTIAAQVAHAMNPISTETAKICEQLAVDFCSEAENELTDDAAKASAISALAEYLTLSENEWAALIGNYLDRAIGKVNPAAAASLKEDFASDGEPLSDN